MVPNVPLRNQRNRLLRTLVRTNGSGKWRKRASKVNESKSYGYDRFAHNVCCCRSREGIAYLELRRKMVSWLGKLIGARKMRKIGSISTTTKVPRFVGRRFESPLSPRRSNVCISQKVNCHRCQDARYPGRYVRLFAGQCIVLYCSRIVGETLRKTPRTAELKSVKISRDPVQYNQPSGVWHYSPHDQRQIRFRNATLTSPQWLSPIPNLPSN
jgi:hypothetical protein